MCQISIYSEHFKFWTNLGLADAKYLIKINFDIKIKISIFEISIQPSFNKFWAFFHFGTNWGLTIGKYLIKNIFLTSKLRLAYLKYWMCQLSINSEYFDFGTNLGLIGGKYFIKIIFDIKIEIEIFDISNVPNINKSWAFSILGPAWA